MFTQRASINFQSMQNYVIKTTSIMKSYKFIHLKKRKFNKISNNCNASFFNGKRFVDTTDTTPTRR